MEKGRARTQEVLTYNERQRLLKDVYELADYYQAQMIAAPRQIRGIYIPILSTAKLLWDGEHPPKEQAHIRKVVAAQSHHLKETPDGVGKLSEFRGIVYSLANEEFDEWNNLKPWGLRHRSEWKFAMHDADKIFFYVASAEKELG